MTLDEQRRAFDAPLGVPTYPRSLTPQEAAAIDAEAFAYLNDLNRQDADPEYADVDTDGQLALGAAGDQRAIPGLAAPRKES